MRRYASHRALVLAMIVSQSRSAALAREEGPYGAPHDRDRLGWAVPDFVKLQSGGFSGAVTLGAGYVMFRDRLNAAALYGYVPSREGRDVHSVHVTISVRPGEVRFAAIRWLPLYAGLGTLCTWGPGYFVMPPGRYPRGYYLPTALRASAHLGMEVGWAPRRGPLERHGIFVELVTLDFLLYEQLKNPRLVEPTDIASTALGYRMAF